MIYLRDNYHSTEIKITEHFIDLRRISPVPRLCVTRIYFRKINHQVVVYRAVYFCFSEYEVRTSPVDLQKDIEFLLEDFLLKN